MPPRSAAAPASGPPGRTAALSRLGWPAQTQNLVVQDLVVHVPVVQNLVVYKFLWYKIWYKIWRYTSFGGENFRWLKIWWYKFWWYGEFPSGRKDWRRWSCKHTLHKDGII